MNRTGRILLGVVICSLSGLAAHAQDDEAEGRRIAEAAIKTGAIDYLTDRDFKLTGPHLEGTARAIDPKEHLKIELREFELLPGRVNLKFKMVARFRFEGKVTIEDTATDVRGEADIGKLISLEAKYWLDDRGLHVDAKATEMKFSAKVREIIPEDFAGGKAGAAKIILKQLRRQREELLRDFNEWQAKYQQQRPLREESF